MTIEPHTTVWEGPFRVLLVEDDIVDAQRIRRMLSEAGEGRFELGLAPTLAAAVDELTNGQWDLVVLDLSLPDASGLECPSRVHATAPNVPIVVLTGGIDDLQWSVQVLHQGVQDYLVKDQVTPPLLVRSLRYAIERQKMMEEMRQAPKEDAVGVHSSAHFQMPSTDPSGPDTLAMEMRRRGMDVVHICSQCGLCFSSDVKTCPQDGADMDTTRPIPYRVQGRYRLLRKLAVGGMGTIFVALDENLDREVAVKILNQQHFNSPQAHLRLKREARAVARIQHPNVIVVFDQGRLLDNSVFIVMELLTGIPLDKVIKQWGRGTPRQVSNLVRQAGAALTAAHEANVLHRDIEPENILLAETPLGYKVKLLDFGIAKNLEMRSNLTQAGLLIGTPAYLAPELINGQTADFRSDMYSFAALAYEALTGRGVTLQRDFGKVLSDILKNSPPAPSSLLPGLPPGLDEAFAQALHKNPNQRPESIAAWSESVVDMLDACEVDGSGWDLQMLEPRRRKENV